LNQIEKILIFRLSSIGDIILCSGLITALSEKFPNAKIDFVVKKQFHDLVKYNPHIHKIFLVDKNKGFSGLQELKKEIKQEHYDVFFDIHKNFRSLFIRTCSKAKKVVTFQKNVLKRTLLTSFKIDTYKEYSAVYKRFIDAGKVFGLNPNNYKTSFYTSPQAQKSIQTVLNKKGIEPKNYIILVPGASFSNKQWLPERFISLSKRIKEQNILPVFLGGPKEKDLCESMAQESEGSNFAGYLNLLESAELIKHSLVVVSNDTGMLHLAEAQDVPVVGIYGPTARQFGFYPLLDKSIAVDVDLPCRPCTKMGMNKCPKGHFKCMRDISVDMVFSALQTIISRS